MTRSHQATIVPPDVMRRAIARALHGRSRAQSRGSAHASTPVHAATDKAVAPPPPDAPTRLGDIELVTHQREAVLQLRAVMQQHHVALLADEVGLGKTFVSLAIARDYDHACVIAPAALLPMWRAALQQAADTTTSLHSLHAYSRASRAAPWGARTHCPASPPSRVLVIIDEAHHLRTPSTRRYGAVAAAVAGCDLLLVSATPIHNRSADLRALLALALGSQVDRLTQHEIADVIVRRRQTDTGGTGAVPRVATPTVRAHPPLTVPTDSTLLSALLAIPAPLPAHDGAVAGALIKLGLLRAWCSSDAALLSQLRRRILRCEALQQAIVAGRHPTTSELRSWVLGDDDMQLGFPELLATHPVADGPVASVLARHLEALRFAASHLRRAPSADAHRLRAVRQLLDTHPESSIVAFSQYAETIRAVARGLADIAGVGALTGQRAWIASGPIRRQEVLEAFAPFAHGRPPPPAHQRVRLLLTTDLLAEGVNLHDANIVVHLDLPWTHALRDQRVGRCARVGSAHQYVEVYTLQPHRQAAALLRLHERLRSKAHIAAAFVGTRSAAHGLSAAESASQLRTWIAAWSSEPDTQPLALTRDAVTLTLVPSQQRRALLLLLDGADQRHLLAASFVSVRGSRRYRVSNNARVVVRLLARLAAHERPRGESPAGLTTSACEAAAAQWLSEATALQRAVRRWATRRRLAAELGERESDATPVHRRARALLQAVMERSTVAQRTARHRWHHDALQMIEAVRGREAERTLQAWTASAATLAPDIWLTRWREWPVLADLERTTGTAASAPRHVGGSRRPQIAAVVLFAPCDPTTFRACHDMPCFSISTVP
ncbi:MAG: DEAD/DEAH box helicase [Gemmatimonadaceae bacterium]|nr:DEAD/DEAH box helicase [Gemmatimonadaceae bacterium]